MDSNNFRLFDKTSSDEIKLENKCGMVIGMFASDKVYSYLLIQ